MPTVTPIVRSTINHGPQLHILGGQFAFGSISVPYFTAHMSLSQACDSLQTPSELSAWTDEDEEIEALYQRSIDYGRVERSILPYLRDDSGRKPKFFNAITVALVPRRGNHFVEFNDPELRAPGLPNPSGTTVRRDTGPISLGFYQDFDAQVPETYALAEMCWNKDQVACVAIDGQHRLQALKRLRSLNMEAGKNTRICVIFIVPSEDLGYRYPAGDQNRTVLRLLRRVFIDLNKHAVPVKRARLILLDDVDPQSLIVRRLVGERLCSTTYPLEVQDARIPLTLVDWHSDDAKFDQGPYLTSVLMLDRVVQTLLGSPPIKDWTDKSSVKRQYEALQSYGFVPTDDCKAELELFLGSDTDWPHPFSYDEHHLQSIQKVVGSAFAPIVWRVFQGIPEYQTIVETRAENEMLLADFSSWFERYASKDRTSEDNQVYLKVTEHVRSKQNPPSIDEWIRVLNDRIDPMKKESLLFKVVFQNAIFEAIQQLWRVALPVFQEGDTPGRGTEAHRLFWTDNVISVFRSIDSSSRSFWKTHYEFENEQGGRTTFWLGSVQRVDNFSIDFTNAGMLRGAKWIKFMTLVFAALESYRKMDTSPPVPNSFEELLGKIDEFDVDYRKVLANEQRQIVKGNTANVGSMARVINGQDIQQDQDETDEAFQERLDMLAEIEFLKRAQNAFEKLREAM